MKNNVRMDWGIVREIVLRSLSSILRLMVYECGVYAHFRACAPPVATMYYNAF